MNRQSRVLVSYDETPNIFYLMFMNYFRFWETKFLPDPFLIQYFFRWSALFYDALTVTRTLNLCP